ncbi:DUF2807 domain-containing protein [bacterium]|nr:DUF2807 domain-containing protein [bacterium]
MSRHRIPAASVAILAAALVVASAAVAGVHWHDAIEGSGDMETRAYDLKDFQVIELTGALDIEVVFGDKQSVEVTLDDNLFENLEIDVKGKTLVIGWAEECDPDADSRVAIALRRLDAVTIKGAGDIEIKGFKGDRFEYDLHGAGDLEIDGETGELDITLNGAGGVEAEDLKARHVKVRLNGVGDVEVTATESIDAKVSGVGEIDFWGKPEEEKTRVSGIGDINRR